MHSRAFRGGAHQALAYVIAHNNSLYGIIAIDAIAAQDGVGLQKCREGLIRKKRTFYTAYPERYERTSELMKSPDKTQMTIKQIIEITGGFYFYRPELAKDAFDKMEYNDEVLKFTYLASFQSQNLLPELHHITVICSIPLDIANQLTF